MEIVEKIRDWLNGKFTCIRCGETFHPIGTFGYGKFICYDCYKGEDPWLFPQDPIIGRLYNRG